MYVVDEDFDDDDDAYMFFDNDSLRNKKRLTLSDFLPVAQVSDGFDWGTGSEAKKQPRLILTTMQNGERMFVDDFRLAAMNGKSEQVKQFIAEAKLPVDTLLKDEWTALMTAASAAQDQIVLLLLESGADPNLGKKDFKPLMAAVCATADCDNEVLENRIVTCVTHLIKFGAKVDAMDLYRTTALHFAVKKNHIQVAKALLDHKANVNAQDYYAATATHIAAKFGYGQMIRVLLDAGADLNLMDNNGLMPENTAYSNDFGLISDLLTRYRKDRSLSCLPVEVGKVVPPEQKSFGESDAADADDDVARVMHNDFQVFLRGFGLADLEPAFLKHGLSTPPDVLKLKEEDLDKIGILSNQKQKLMAVIEKFPADLMSTPSPLPVPKKHVSSPELYNFLVNMRRQLLYMEAALTVVERNVCRNPVTLQRGIEMVPADGVMSEFSKCCNNVSAIQRVLHDIDQDLKTAKKLGVESPGLIREGDQDRGRRGIAIPVLLAGGAVLCGLLCSGGLKNLNFK